MKWRFWKKTKPAQDKTEPYQGHPNARCVMVLRPEAVEATILDRLDHKVEVGFDPNFRGSFPWFVSFDVSFTWRGESFGLEGPALVRECGVMFPNARMPWVQEFRMTEDNRFVWASYVRPTAHQIAQVVQETQRQVEDYMRAFWFDKKSDLVRKKRP